MEKNNWKNHVLFFCGLFLLLSTGCIRVEYTGKTLQALPEDARIAVLYNSAKLPLPPDKLEKVGSLSATASTASNTVNDMRNRIIECARSHGAN
ncbi:MAG: hypothetical protein IKA79_08295, partial [Lentisphaeria bacterium]|nr:hypothetical protein [Lentisphaeria bacterium]